MAEIKIEEKRRSWLPWVLGVVAVAALVWFLSAQNDPDSRMADRTPALDTGSASGTLAPRDSARIRNDTMSMVPPR